MTKKGGSAPSPFLELEHSTLLEARALAARLSHHLGKYVSRVARNLPNGEVRQELKDLLIKDLYGLEDDQPASAVFAALALPLKPLIGEVHLKACRALLRQIDHLEQDVRQGEDGAVHRAASLAIEVDDMLKALAKELTEACHDR